MQNATSVINRVTGQVTVQTKTNNLDLARIKGARKPLKLGNQEVWIPGLCGSRLNEVECYKCHQTGHWANACSNEPGSGGGGDRRGGPSGGSSYAMLCVNA